MTKRAREPRSRNRSQRHCKKRNRCRVHCCGCTPRLADRPALQAGAGRGSMAVIRFICMIMCIFITDGL